MSGGDPPAPRRAGDLLLAEAPFETLELDARRACATLVAGGRRIVFVGVRATTLLSPWDGTAGWVESLRIVAAAADELCLELRVRWREVPRVYRMVCARVTVE